MGRLDVISASMQNRRRFRFRYRDAVVCPIGGNNTLVRPKLLQFAIGRIGTVAFRRVLKTQSTRPAPTTLYTIHAPGPRIP